MPISLRALSIALVLAGIITSPVTAAPQQDQSTELLLRGAKNWASKDRPDLAKNLLQKLLLIEPASQDALFMLGNIELKNGKPDEALRHLRALEQTAPNSPRTQELGAAYRQSTAARTPAVKAPAEKEAEKTLKPAPADKPPLGEPGQATRQAAAKLRHKKKPQNTDEEVASLANSPDIIARSAALDALDDGNLEFAETSLLDILKRRPQDPEVLGGLGITKLRQGKSAEAEKWFEQAFMADKEKGSKWHNLMLTAGLWKNLHAAEALLEEQKLSEAEATVQQALVLQPEDPDALALLGRIKEAGNKPVEAERLYRNALKKMGYNVSALRGLTGLLSRTQRSSEALELVEQAHKNYSDELERNPDAHAGLLRVEADLYIEAHRPSHAIKALEKAVLIAPKDAWSRFSLAKLYISLGLSPLGRQVMQEGAALSPDDANMHYVRALVLLSLNDYAAGLDSLAQIPETKLTKPMLNARNNALDQYRIQQAENKLAQGNRKEAIRIMSIAEAQARGNFSATAQVAEGWFRLGQQNMGISAMRRLPQPAPLGTQVYLASLLNRAKKDQELAEYLPSLRIPAGADDATQKYRATIRDIEFAMAGRQFDRLMSAGQKEQAQQFASSVLNTSQLSNADYFSFHRNYFSRAELPENAISQLTQEKEQYPDDLNIRWDLAYAYYQGKQNSNAQRELQELLSLTKEDDIDTRLRAARLQRSMGDNAAARVAMDDLAGRFPNNTEVLLQAGNFAQADGNYNQAMGYYQRTREQLRKPADVTATRQAASPDLLLDLLPAKPSQAESAPAPRRSTAPALVSTKESDSIYRLAIAGDVGREKSQANTPAMLAEQEMNRIAAQRSAKIEAGLEKQSKTASNGTSTYNATEIPLLARFPIGYEAHGTIQVDTVNVDAGVLPANFKEAAVFGKIQAYPNAPRVQPLTPKASGTSIGLGYEQGSVKADIGVIGMGFPVSNVVGGVRQGGYVGRLSYSLNLSRRPYTGSQLSYAGARDPVTGATWGGVTNTGLSLYLSTRLDSFNVAAMASYGLLRGNNVLNNDRLYLRASVDRNFYTTDDLVLNLGLNANYSSFSKNESFFTFGHGGYYSPQSSLSFSLPVTLNGRVDLLSYQIIASLSHSRTREDPAVFYPTDPALQALASVGPNFASYYKQAVYPGGTGGGFGYGLRAAAEYRLTPNFVLGGRFTMERSAYYDPNAVLFYLRYLFNPETGPVSLYPVPVIPYAQY